MDILGFNPCEKQKKILNLLQTLRNSATQLLTGSYTSVHIPALCSRDLPPLHPLKISPLQPAPNPLTLRIALSHLLPHHRACSRESRTFPALPTASQILPSSLISSSWPRYHFLVAILVSSIYSRVLEIPILVCSRVGSDNGIFMVSCSFFLAFL